MARAPDRRAIVGMARRRPATAARLLITGLTLALPQRRTRRVFLRRARSRLRTSPAEGRTPQEDIRGSPEDTLAGTRAEAVDVASLLAWRDLFSGQLDCVDLRVLLMVS